MAHVTDRIRFSGYWVRVIFSRNPTHGSGLLRPGLQEGGVAAPESHPQQWVDVSGSAFGRRARSRGVCGLAGYRQHLNLPPTAVGGIQGSSSAPVFVGWV